MSAINFHDQIAAGFNDKYRFSKAFRERFQVWTRLFGKYIYPSDRIIDLGCGSGIFSNYLAEKGCFVTGIDGSAAMIDLCERQKTSVNAQFFQASLPLTYLEYFAPQDVVLMSSFLEYIADPVWMLVQVETLLRPNGLLIVSIPNQRSFYRMLERNLFWLTKRPTYLTHSRYAITPNAFNRQLKVLGFDLLETVYFSALDPVSRVLKPFFAEQYVNNLFVGVYRKRA